jgi:tetratricopeptide (TPR) repeat protein
MLEDNRPMTATISKLSLIRLAERYINLGNPRGAIDPLRRVLVEDPDHVLAHAYLGMCLQEIGQSAAARASIETALTLAPEYGFVSYAAGLVALLQKRFEEAEEQLTSARRLMPAHAETYRLLAVVYGRTRRPGKVLPTLQEGLSHDPSSVRIIADIGMHWLNIGRLAQAEEQGQQALSLDPESVAAHVLMGYVQLHRRDRDAARECALMALTRNASYAPALQLMSTIKLQANPLIGLWWRFAIWLGRRGNRKIFMGVWVALSLIYWGAIATLTERVTWLAVGIVASFTLCFASLLFAKWLFRRGIRNELREFRLRHGF